MPFFSFILKRNFHSSSLGDAKENSIALYKNKKYYSKNTSIWKKFNSNKFRKNVIAINAEKRVKIGQNIKKIIFCLPPNIGLGDSIEYALAIKAINESKIFHKIAIAFSGKFSLIIKDTLKLENIFPEFLSENDIKKYEGLFHFTLEINSLKLQKYKRKNIEECILKFFKINIYRNLNKQDKNIVRTVSIFPISKSPIRTLSSSLINNINEFLVQKKICVKVFLDNESIISNEFKKNLNIKNIKIYSPKNIYLLKKYIKDIDFGIFCDSGPLHLSKLYNKRGILISTSVGAKNLISNKDNIISYNSKYQSNYCVAPCGLTNIINVNNFHGCYDSLKINKKNFLNKNIKINLLNRGDLKKSYEFYMKNPVGCVNSLNFQDIRFILNKALNI